MLESDVFGAISHFAPLQLVHNGVLFEMMRKASWFRMLALALAAYSLLASARELVPGLCATLASLQDGAAACHTAVPSCCAGSLESSSDFDVPSIHTKGAEHPQCAFCTLVKGLIKAEAAVAIPANPASPEALSSQSCIAPITARVCAESRPRDPPSALA